MKQVQNKQSHYHNVKITAFVSTLHTTILGNGLSFCIYSSCDSFLGQSATVGRDLTYSYQSERGQDKFVCGVIPSHGKHVGSYS